MSSFFKPHRRQGVVSRGSLTVNPEVDSMGAAEHRRGEEEAVVPPVLESDPSQKQPRLQPTRNAQKNKQTPSLSVKTPSNIISKSF